MILRNDYAYGKVNGHIGSMVKSVYKGLETVSGFYKNMKGQIV